MTRFEYFREIPIASLSTAPGGALSIVRVSGKNLIPTLLPLNRQVIPELRDRQATLVRVFDPENHAALDDAVLIWFAAPRSFTGEDVVELHLHGGAYLANRVLECLRAIGIAQALPGEFSFRAVRNGKLTITQAQAISDLISARNDRALKLALDNLSGAQNALITEIAAQLRRTLTLAEAGIDFSDQDIEEVALERLTLSLESPRQSLKRLSDSFSQGYRIQEGIPLALVGLPNAGKSSLFNALLGEDRSIVSDVAGTTRDTIRETLTLKNARSSLTFRLEDTAGLRSSDDPIEKQGIARSEKAAKNAEVILFVADPTQSAAEAKALYERMNLQSKRVVGVLTKRDLSGEFDLSSLPSLVWVETSALTRQGMGNLINQILSVGEALMSRSQLQGNDVYLTRLEHYAAVCSALEHLGRAVKAPDHASFSADLRQTLAALAPLIGETLTEDILGKIFSEFCIGK